MATFSLLTINTYGLPVVASRARLRTLGALLNDQDVDIACLQEIQTHGYKRLMLDAASGYPHYAYEPFLYAPKGGLLTLSRGPFERADFMLYQARGPVLSTEWPLHKGVLATELRHMGRTVVVLNTHLYLNFVNVARNWRPTQWLARIEQAQVRQLVGLVRAQPPDALVVVCGDFNFPRGSFLYDELVRDGGLVDPLAGDTRPTWRSTAPTMQRFAQPLDFVLLREPGWGDFSAKAELCFEAPVPLLNGRVGRLSDHVGLTLRVAWAESRPDAQHRDPMGR